MCVTLAAPWVARGAQLPHGQESCWFVFIDETEILGFIFPQTGIVGFKFPLKQSPQHCAQWEVIAVFPCEGQVLVLVV